MKRFHEYSRSSRYRIRKLLQNARNNIPIEETSSDSEEEVNPSQRPQRRKRQRAEVEDAVRPIEHLDDSDNNNTGSSQPALSNIDSSNESANEVENLNEEPQSAVENYHLDNTASGTDNITSVHTDSGSEVEILNEQSAGEDEHLDHTASGTDNAVHTDEDIENDEVLNHPFGDISAQSESEVEGDFQAEEDDGWDIDDQAHIYDMAPISLGESMLAILSFYLRHNLSLKGLSDLLSLIDLHCRREGKRFTKSVHQFKKFFGTLQFPIIRHYYCRVCFQRLPDGAAICQNGHEFESDFFIQLPVISQLKALYKRPGFQDKLNYKLNRTKFVHDNYEDIYDGAIYRSLSQDGQILSDPSNISLMWYTDGVSIFKSSKSEIWPFYLVINELPYNDRTKVSNALLAGLWFGKCKPAPATFLEPIREELVTLRRGVNISFGNPVVNRTVKGIVMCGSADIPAKAKFLNFKAHNAAYGCAKCKIRSVNVRRGLNVYPYRGNLDLRLEQETVRFAQEALQMPIANGYQQDVFGVKGPSILSTFVYKWVQSASVDEMHCVFLGLMKALLALWFEPKFSNRDFSLSNQRDLVNIRMAEIKPPSFVQRLTRNLDDSKYWKGHELKTFLFYYSLPVLCDLMPDLYLDHHNLLVLGLYLLNQRSIPEPDVNKASQMLSEYVSQFEDLYGIDNMSCNLHQLLHLADVVRDLGPLWVTSCFPFEDMNGKLKKLVKGTRSAELQVCSGVSMLLKLAELNNHIPDNSETSVYVKTLFDVNSRIKALNIGRRTAIIGKYIKKMVLPERVEEALQTSNVNGRNFYEFYRLMKYSHIFGSDCYERAIKTKSNCVKFKQMGDVHFGFIDRFLRVTNCGCDFFCNGCEAKYFAIIKKSFTRLDYAVFDDTKLPHIHSFRGDGDHVAVDVSDLICICFVVNISDRDTTYLIEPVNMVEAE